ncbi:MAG TPA: ClpXP protease specificity-enhancing factor [Burkholderiaceae bacterium]|nr:ClpXP protease specificity-enhancing factor [Burkholderiaceae bacterium]
MPEIPTKPYLIRAIHQWCTDSGYTPYIAVLADETVRVPRDFVKNGEIVLNISPLATNRLQLGNETIEFQARFGGVAREVMVPIDRVLAVYARENGQGMAFEVPRDAAPAGVDQPEATPLPRAPMVLVPIEGRAAREDVEPSNGESEAQSPPDDTPPPRGERPKLTRIK